MALEITYLNEDAPTPRLVVHQRLFVTADRRRLVPDGHAEAAFLFCGEGQEVLQNDFEALELDESCGKVVAVKPEPPAAEASGGEGASEGNDEDKPKAKRSRSAGSRRKR